MNAMNSQQPAGAWWLRGLHHGFACVLLSISLTATLLLGLTTHAWAQDNLIVPTNRPFIVGIDDELNIVSPTHEEVNQQVVVLHDGTISVAGIEETVPVFGKSLVDIQKILAEKLSKSYRNLRVSVSLKAMRSRRITVNGTRQPGLYPITRETHVSEMLAAAGGIPAKLKMTTAKLIRVGEREPIILDLEKILGKNPSPDADILVRNGDTIIVNTGEEPPPPTYSVSGAVVKGGSFQMPLDGTPISIARAVADAGGANPSAQLKKVLLLRDDKTIEFDIYSLLIEGRTDVLIPSTNERVADIKMQDGDVLIVPELKAKFTVFGAVARSATLPLPEARTIGLLEAVTLAGGPVGQAELRKVVHTRTINGEVIRTPVNVLDLTNHPERAPEEVKNLIIEDGDIIFVPLRGEVTTLRDASTILGNALNPFWIITNIFRR